MREQSTSDGTLSIDDFYIAAKALCERWKSANSTLSNWTWIPCKRIPIGVSYNDLASSHQELFKAEQPEDSATVVQFPSCVIHEYDFHIAYSFSYRTPVLYFHGRQSDGQPLDLGDIQKDLPEYSLKLLRESKWTFITLEDHPFLHRPWYMLHPCGTSEWMRLLLSGVQQENPCAVNYLVSWLSVVGQAVGLRIPASLTTSCFIDCSSSSIA
ncbi:ubiquitin-like-conjugating enzyme ATG10 isoform X2 [Phalaenopsis equestris]|uniref:ubiquitin-like-conjugating enzyme ATG10 isoform X2 n=1 Tax=Phalaenopsis equestris TaxID=78828 RepID=UPI0009E2DD30|nr:ubiquitin-like-conjugating enzyme ATG10 isoform X2 [Phalaenopsis equestris]